MSATGLSVTSSRYSGCGAAITSRSDLREDVVERAQGRVGGHVRVGAQHRAGLEGQDPLELVGQAGPGVVGAALERHAEDADGHGRQVEALLQAVHQVQRHALVDGHRGVAEREVVVVERRELHGVLEQARPGGEARGRHVGGPRVVLGQPLPDALEVEAAVVGHHVELVGGRELDVPPDVGEQLGQLGLFRRQRRRAGRSAGGTARWPGPRRAAVRAETICGSSNSSVIALPSAMRSGQNATSMSMPSAGDHLFDQRGHPGVDGAAQDEDLPVAQVAGAAAQGVRDGGLVRVEVLVHRGADDHDHVLGGAHDGRVGGRFQPPGGARLAQRPGRPGLGERQPRRR